MLSNERMGRSMDIPSTRRCLTAMMVLRGLVRITECGAVYLRRGEYQSAIEELDYAIRRGPTFVLALPMMPRCRTGLSTRNTHRGQQVVHVATTT